MTKILFVCHGNICRSPMAEFIMKELVLNKGIAEDFYIESAATSCEELGNGVYPPVKRLLANRGIDCSKKRARRVTADDGGRFDYIICMDSYNVSNVKRILNPNDYGKIYKLLDFTGSSRDVADPWYTRDFEATERDVVSGCESLIEHIRSKNEN